MKIDFDKMQGLVPAIVQDSRNGDVLMLGFMNLEAWERTQTLGYVTFYSRTRNELWTKGESSGNRLRVVSISTDCDRDSLLIQVEVEGAGMVCHEGTRSCFTKPIRPVRPLMRWRSQNENSFGNSERQLARSHAPAFCSSWITYSHQLAFVFCLHRRS